MRLWPRPVMERGFDVAILGAGFGGSLTALIAQRLGLRAVLIERGAHPRFAIGESATPQTNLVLGALARRYRLGFLEPLCKYGTWRRAHPELVCGLKRGFSYFHHVEAKPFDPRSDRANELLVAASRDDEHSDTHWLRSDFDSFLVDQVREAGILYLDRTDLTGVEQGDVCRIEGRRGGRRIEIGSSFVVDASGAGGALSKALGIPTGPGAMRTHSRSVYAHFEGVIPWQEIYEGAGGQSADHPYRCHAAALHHVFAGGWMYVLHFDNGVTSAGFVLDGRAFPSPKSASPEQEFRALLERLPSVADQFRNAVPLTRLVRTGRMQRRASRATGPGWAMLPFAAAFVDPLHSPGNALTLIGIERLARALEREGATRSRALEEYEDALFRDVDVLDKIVHGCYAGFARFDLMVSYAMIYFAGAHYTEALRRRRPDAAALGFANSHDPEFRHLVDDAHRRVCELAATDALGPDETSAFEQHIARAIAPYNLAGLCDAAKRNLYECV